MVNENAEKVHGIDESGSASQVPENKLRHNFRLGDITWVKLIGSSWWPAQVCFTTLQLVSISFTLLVPKVCFPRNLANYC
jgi:hypothetical protein